MINQFICSSSFYDIYDFSLKFSLGRQKLRNYEIDSLSVEKLFPYFTVLLVNIFSCYKCFFYIFSLIIGSL